MFVQARNSNMYTSFDMKLTSNKRKKNLEELQTVLSIQLLIGFDSVKSW